MYSPEDHRWWHYAACAGMSVNLWFPEVGRPDRAATATCRSCPVSNECVTEAVREESGQGHRFGIRGGLGPSQRRRLDQAG